VTEPASIVLMQGDEVAMEFEEALDGAAEAQAPIVTPTIAPMADMEPMVPIAPLIAPVGQVLGGETRRMADGRPWNPWR
jgi:hypothetical protein